MLLSLAHITLACRALIGNNFCLTFAARRRRRRRRRSAGLRVFGIAVAIAAAAFRLLNSSSCFRHNEVCFKCKAASLTKTLLFKTPDSCVNGRVVVVAVLAA